MTHGIVLLYAGALALLLVALSLNVVRLRWKHRVGIGTGNVEELECAARAQANFAEYVPLALLVLALLEASGLAGWSVHALGLALLVGRLLHAVGLSGSSGPSRARQIGILLTWLVLVVGGLVAIVRAGSAVLA